MDIAKKVEMYKRIGQMLDAECAKYTGNPKTKVNHYINNGLTGYDGYVELLETMLPVLSKEKREHFRSYLLQRYASLKSYLALLKTNEQFRNEHCSDPHVPDDEHYIHQILNKHKDELAKMGTAIEILSGFAINHSQQ